MKIVVSIDVEEEGLFSGKYPRVAQGVSNVERLRLLEWMSRDYGIPLTLLSDYPVVSDPSCAEYLRWWVDELGAEVGAHLHPWNTPPFDDEVNSLDSGGMPKSLVNSKLSSLRVAIEDNLSIKPTSFRMGRWDFSKAVCDALTLEGFRVDSSVAPLKMTPAGDSYFGASADPFWLDDKKELLEVPLTLVPIIPFSAQIVEGSSRVLPKMLRQFLVKSFSKIGAVGVQPVWYSLAAMKLAAMLHQERGGAVLVLFFHSSELLPGASPHFPTEASVESFIEKLRAFIKWLSHRTDIEGRTLEEIRAEYEV